MKADQKSGTDLEIPDLLTLQLQLKLVGNEGDELGIRRLALGIPIGNNSTNKANPATMRFYKESPHRIGKS